MCVWVWVYEFIISSFLVLVWYNKAHPYTGSSISLPFMSWFFLYLWFPKLPKTMNSEWFLNFLSLINALKTASLNADANPCVSTSQKSSTEYHVIKLCYLLIPHICVHSLAFKSIPFYFQTHLAPGFCYYLQHYSCFSYWLLQ